MGLCWVSFGAARIYQKSSSVFQELLSRSQVLERSGEVPKVRFWFSKKLAFGFPKVRFWKGLGRFQKWYPKVKFWKGPGGVQKSGSGRPPFMCSSDNKTYAKTFQKSGLGSPKVVSRSQVLERSGVVSNSQVLEGYGDVPKIRFLFLRNVLRKSGFGFPNVRFWKGLGRFQKLGFRGIWGGSNS